MVVKRFDVFLINLDKARLVRRLGRLDVETQTEVLAVLAEMFAE